MKLELPNDLCKREPGIISHVFLDFEPYILDVKCELVAVEYLSDGDDVPEIAVSGPRALDSDNARLSRFALGAIAVAYFVIRCFTIFDDLVRKTYH